MNFVRLAREKWHRFLAGSVACPSQPCRRQKMYAPSRSVTRHRFQPPADCQQHYEQERSPPGQNGIVLDVKVRSRRVLWERSKEGRATPRQTMVDIGRDAGRQVIAVPVGHETSRSGGKRSANALEVSERALATAQRRWPPLTCANTV